MAVSVFTACTMLFVCLVFLQASHRPSF